IHRDIKPSNIIVMPNKYPKILDFGVASYISELDRDPIISTTSSSLGDINAIRAIHYTAPEQLRGKLADARSDIFSLGALFYEMLSGIPPFEGQTSVDVMKNILTEDMSFRLKASQQLPRELQHIITTALQKDPGSRYQEAGEMLEDIRQFRDSLEVSK